MKYSSDDYHRIEDRLYVPEMHHDDKCEVYWKGERWSYGEVSRSFWCATHGQWTYNFPIKMVPVWKKDLSDLPECMNHVPMNFVPYSRPDEKTRWFCDDCWAEIIPDPQPEQ